MTAAIEVPDEYGYVILAAIFGHLLTNFYLTGRVVAGREALKVEYPNLYATPGYHKEADAFNRIQRGHQNFLETLPLFIFLALLGGLQYPRVVAGACGVHCVGSILYQAGYADTKLDVKTARFKKGGGLKYAGFLAVLVSAVVSFKVNFMGMLKK